MELTEKNGQASMEEILASIRRIIAEDPGKGEPVIDLDAPLRQNKWDGLLDDPSDFDLPSIFRVQPAPAATERPAPLFGRLSEAIRAASNGHSHTGENGRGELGLSSLRLPRNEAVAGEAKAAHPPAFLLSAFHETTASPETAVGTPDRASAEGSVEEPATSANGSDMSHASSHPAAPSSHEAPLNGVHEVNGSADAARLGGSAPEVPRQMAAFKDTRFRGMGVAPCPAANESVSTWVSPFESAATDALVTAADPPPENLAEAVPAEVAPTNISYPAFESPEDGNGSPVTLVPPPPPLPPSVASEFEACVDKFTAAPIEDATADLLRPMLRQWLADNMPRMVEKALHIEVAETVKTGKK